MLTVKPLKLSAKQIEVLSAIALSWQQEKAKLLVAMNSFDPKRGRADQLSASLAGFSDLSRNYDLRRMHYWLEAERLLSPEQLAAIRAGVR